MFAPRLTRPSSTTARPSFPLQAKLTVGAVDDPLEHEADRVADQVLRMRAPDIASPAARPQIRRKCSGCEEQDELKRKPAEPGRRDPRGLDYDLSAVPVHADAPGTAPPIVDEVLRSSGRPLDAATRDFMEPRFGRDFSTVRLHTGAEATRSAAAVGASAYTVGHHVVVAGDYKPEAPAARRLLAHELTHVVQQGAAARSSGVAPADAGAVTVSARAGATAGTLSRQPRNPFQPGRTQTTRGDFHDPNFCYRIPLRDATHPDRTRVVAVMQAQIITPSTCDGTITLRTSVLNSGWGADAANFESYGGGMSQGIFQGITRDSAAERVDYEERFRLDGCGAAFEHCHLITYREGGTRYVFAEAFYQPRLVPSSEPSGTVITDTTPSPGLVVEPCDNLTPTHCGGGAGGGTSGGAGKASPPGEKAPANPPARPPARRPEKPGPRRNP